MSGPGDLQPRQDARPNPPRLRPWRLARRLSRRLSWTSLILMLPAAATLAALVLVGLDDTKRPAKPVPVVAQREFDLNPEITGSVSASGSVARPERTAAPFVRVAPAPAASAAPAQPHHGVRAAPDFAAVRSPSMPAGTGAAGGADAAAAQGATPQPSGARAPGALSLSPDAIVEHLARGEQKLRAGELATARLYFERVVRAGDARGALAMARSYDPVVLSDLPLIGPQGDADTARKWYERATSLQAGIPVTAAR
jgi:hypothetical protein